MTVRATLTSTWQPRVRTAGLVCFWGALVGAAQAVFMIVVPASVGADRYSYPFGPTGYTVAQLTFFAQHLTLCAGLWALIALPAVRASRVARIGASVALVGVVLLALMELVGIAAAGVAADSGLATAVNDLYGPPVLLAGIGLTMAGAVLLRRGGRAWPGPVWLRFVPLLTGLYVFVALIPSLTGSYVVARLGIGGWMLLFAALGWGLYRSDAAQ